EFFHLQVNTTGSATKGKQPGDTRGAIDVSERRVIGVQARIDDAYRGPFSHQSRVLVGLWGTYPRAGKIEEGSSSRSKAQAVHAWIGGKGKPSGRVAPSNGKSFTNGDQPQTQGVGPGTNAHDGCWTGASLCT